MSNPIVRRCLLLLVVAGLAALVVPSASAQVPDEFSNLMIFPEDIGKQELVGIMRGWAGALGQRCNFCHPGPDNLRGIDFASDESEHKQVARKMAKMVGEINGKLLPASDSSDMRVTCVTCHHGLKEPETINHIMFEVIASDGVPAALETYAELREEHYGRGRYDFGHGPLNTVAETLAREQDNVAGAIAVMEANVEYHQDAAYPFIVLGQLYAANEDVANAQKNLERALEIDPENDRAKRMLSRVKQAAGDD